MPRLPRVPIVVVVHCDFTFRFVATAFLVCRLSSRSLLKFNVSPQLRVKRMRVPQPASSALAAGHGGRVRCQWEWWCVRSVGDIMLACSSAPSL
jgi:hypothetical protein